MNKDDTTVTLHKRMDEPSKGAIAFWDGDKLDHNDQEVWIWLPRSKIIVTELEGDVCEVELPEWLAMKEGLI